MEKPFSQACENNKQPILDVITPYFEHSKMVLEIGTGTAQHAIHFAEHLKNLFWQTSDQEVYLEGINLTLNEYQHDNIGRPLPLDVTQQHWPVKQCEGVFSANTSHIMSWHMVKQMFTGVAKILLPEANFCLYGPFNFDGQYTSVSNESFDTMLRQRDPLSGLRNFEDLLDVAAKEALDFVKCHQLPANNCILVWTQPKT